MSLPHTAGHIAASAGGYEPQRKNNFMLYLTPKGGGDSATIELSLSKFPFPKETTESQAIDYLNEQRKVAGKSTYEGFALALKDYVDQQTAQVIRGWRRAVFNPLTGETGLAKNYKSDGFLHLFAPDGSSVRKWKLVGVWPSDFAMGEGDMTSAEPVEITCTLQVDYIDMEV